MCIVTAVRVYVSISAASEISYLLPEVIWSTSSSQASILSEYRYCTYKARHDTDQMHPTRHFEDISKLGRGSHQ